MLFEDNIIFLILKVTITCAGTFGMMGSTTKFRYVKEKPISIIIFASYFIYCELCKKVTLNTIMGSKTS